jgi:hypothetical protein
MSVEDAASTMNIIKKPDARDWTALPYDDKNYLSTLKKRCEWAQDRLFA